jgi:predicted dehydrogenase
VSVEPLRWGVLGVADIAVNNVIPAMQATSITPIVGIASRSAERARAAAAELGIDRAFDSYESLLASSEIDAVYIPLPNHLHREWTIAAADAGKHVLCEKPLALSVADARTMFDHCERSGVALMEAFMYRLHPLWQTLTSLVTEGRIGEARAIQTVFSYFNDDPADIRNQQSTGGGALLDVGCYAVNLARMLFGGEPTAVHASVRRDPRFGTDAMTSAVLDFDGRHATFVCSTQLEPAQRVEVLGTDGRIVVEIPFNIPPDRPSRLMCIAGGSPPAAPDVEVIEIPAADPYGEQAVAFTRAVRLGAPLPIPPLDAIGNIAVIESIFAAGA